MYRYGRHFGSFYRNPTILETVSDFDSSSWQLNLSTAQNDFSKFRPGWWQFCWMTGVKFNSIHSILVKFLHITQFTVCAAKNLTVIVADSARRLEWSSKFLHITQFTVCAAKNLTVIVADSARRLEFFQTFHENTVAAVSRALSELSEPCLGWTREPGDRRSHSGHVSNSRRRRLITCCRLWPAARRFWLSLHLVLIAWVNTENVFHWNTTTQ